MSVPITDYTLACATGPTTAAALDAIFDGEPGLRSESGLLVGRVPGELAPLADSLKPFDTRQGRLAHAVCSQMRDSIAAARERWGAGRVAVLVGTSTGGVHWTENNYEKGTRDVPGGLRGGLFTKHAFGAVPKLLQTAFELDGPGYTVSTACSSSAQILGSAARLIDQGIVDAALVVGVDTLCELTLRGFGGLGLLSKGSCRPFDTERDGINIGEAGAALLLERESASATAALCGFGSTSDGYHMTRPPPDGSGAVAAMRIALERAGLTADRAIAVNAHGTGTVENDRTEARAIATVFGGRVPVVSTKGYTGHTLGACGALEAIISLETLRREVLPGTAGLRTLDEELEIDADPEARRFDGDVVVSNSLAFGGNNATIVLERV